MPSGTINPAISSASSVSSSNTPTPMSRDPAAVHTSPPRTTTSSGAGEERLGSLKSSNAAVAPGVNEVFGASKASAGSAAADASHYGSGEDESTEDSVSIRCHFLATPEKSPPSSPKRNSYKPSLRAPPPEEGEIFEARSSMKPVVGNETIDLSTLSMGAPAAPKTNGTENTAHATFSVLKPSPSGTSLNAHASHFVPSSASAAALSQALTYTPPDGAIDLSNTTAMAPLDSQDYESYTGKTPNVYINGLPPHFPEDQLFQLAAPFGGVRSVRTFTRHVGDRESGYGFVLFDSVDSAERCINSLRRYRNLHPTFSKQIHKIPGTQYASSASMPSGLSSSAAAHTGEIFSEQWTPDPRFGRAETFKDRMERLADPTSTNLYIEGLPLSIDEPTLAALVSPHHIKSSRFFQTRLSNPPRIIAFVRLDTREGAEEVIERLHGRMVRGWNDTGSRISVRFADTSEQRELRRNERAIQEGDGSPAKLTIAQAALLNLRGQDHVGTMPASKSLGSIGHQSLPPVIGTQNHSPLNIHPVIPERRPLIGSGSYGNISTGSSFNDLASNRATLGDYPFKTRDQTSQREVTPQMSALLDTLRGSADSVPFLPSSANRSLQYTASGNQDGYSIADVDVNSLSFYSDSDRNGVGAASAQARNGYTPTEEYILQAHVAQQRKTGNGIPLVGAARARNGSNIGMGVRGLRSQGQITSPSTSPSTGFGAGGNGGVSLEDEFHAKHGRKGRSVDYGFSSNAAAHNQEEQVKRSPFQAYMPTPQIPSVPRMGGAQNHIRSTTLPHPSSGGAASNQGALHGKRSSLSAMSHRNGDGLRIGVPASNQGFSSNNKHAHYNSNNNVHNSSNDINNNERYNNEQNHQQRQHHHRINHSISKMSIDTRNHHNYEQLNDGTAQEAIVSPSLTYTSRTPSTLSPSTPQFFGSFAGGNGEFNGVPEGDNDRVVVNLKPGGLERKRAMGQLGQRDREVRVAAE